MMRLVIIAVLFVGSETVRLTILPPALGTVCYGDLGCFSIAPPFSSLFERPISLLPQSPDQIKTRYLLYTRDSKENPQVLDARYPERIFDVWTKFVARPTKFIINGFLENVETSPWIKKITEELLKYGDYNVIVVDWSGGNQFPYTQATANTRVVGAQVAACINHIIGKGTLRAAAFHIIGLSLGAHTAGYAGERIPGLGRISGLEPAGPYFTNTATSVRLDPTDALFVDVIHTDTNVLGTPTLSGHADYFPNAGHGQPGCQQGQVGKILENGIPEGLVEIVACNHLRSVYLYIESINSPCTFLAYPCPNEQSFTNNQCQACGDVGCSRMGFHADKYKPPRGQTATYYLRTGASEPYCLPTGRSAS